MALICDGLLETQAGFGVGDDLFAAGLDSMAIMQLLLAIEDDFGIEIPVASVSRKNFNTVEMVGQLVRHRLRGDMGDDSEADRRPDPGADGEGRGSAGNKGEQTRVREDEDRASAGGAVASVRECAAGEQVGGGEARQYAPVVAPPVVEMGPSPMRSCDYFVYAFDKMSRRTGQGGHKAHSFLELDRLPPVQLLREVLNAAANAFPMMSATLHRKWFFEMPEWRQAVRVQVPALHLYSEEGSEGRLRKEGAEQVADVGELLNRICNTPMPEANGGCWPKARFSLIENRDGTAMLVFSWSHLMCDGVGAEIFLGQLERLAAGGSGEPARLLPVPVEPPTFAERWIGARPMVSRFRELVLRKFDCLGPRKAIPGRTLFEVHTLSAEQTLRVEARCAGLGGGVVNAPFFLACAMRAHDRVFWMRKEEPPTYVCNMPVQTRRKGGLGPVFQNHVTMFFGSLRRPELESLENATSLLMEQHTRFVREKMGEAMDQLMYTMRVLPPRVYMEFVSRQMRGPFCSFFHSHTGEFADGLDHFLGASVTNAWHVPGIVAPPGTGIFCNTKRGRLVVTLCWHEEALTLEEREAMLDCFLKDLGAL